MSVIAKPKFLSRAHEVSIKSARKPKSSPFSNAKSMKGKEGHNFPQTQKTFCYSNKNFIANNQSPITKIDSKLKFEIQRIVLSSIENYIRPLRIEISELKRRMSDSKEFDSNIENEPLYTQEKQDILGSYDINKISSCLGSTRRSSKRNLCRDTRNFVPLSTTSLDKRMSVLQDIQKITPSSLHANNITCLVPEKFGDDQSEELKTKKVHHDARSSIIFKKPVSQELCLNDTTNVEMVHKTFQETPKQELGSKRRNKQDGVYTRGHVKSNQNHLQRKVVNDSITSMECTDQKDNHDVLSDYSTGKINEMKVPGTTLCNPDVYIKDEQESFISDGSKTITEPEHVKVKVSHLRSAKISLTTCTCDSAKYAESNRNYEQNCGLYCKYLSSIHQFKAIFGCKKKPEIREDSSCEQYVVPSTWWRKWCDFINIEYNTFEKLSKDTSIQKLSSGLLKHDRNTSRNFLGPHQSSIPVSLHISNLYGETPEMSSHDHKETLQVPSLPRGSNQTSAHETSHMKSESDDQVYSKPGKIINKDLVRIYHCLDSHEEKIALKSSVQEVYDYIKVDKRCWELLKSWYDYDFEVAAPDFDPESCLSYL
ncbi:unnamed protein product [Moneuplotes crassus]|uniref:DUSP domain-containing protein n=1 Tax=Euplotes crassus TaxID=5936 RepID=A0AAD1U5X6_EUPCR|nr:unnamed protein product [Moneuplotes crassus]